MSFILFIALLKKFYLDGIHLLCNLPLRVSNSEGFSLFAELCNHYHKLIPPSRTFPLSSEETPCLLSVSSPLHPAPSPDHTNLLCLRGSVRTERLITVHCMAVQFLLLGFFLVLSFPPLFSLPTPFFTVLGLEPRAKEDAIDLHQKISPLPLLSPPSSSFLSSSFFSPPQIF